MAGLLTGSVFSEDTQTFQGRRRQPPGVCGGRGSAQGRSRACPCAEEAWASRGPRAAPPSGLWVSISGSSVTHVTHDFLSSPPPGFPSSF